MNKRGIDILIIPKQKTAKTSHNKAKFKPLKTNLTHKALKKNNLKFNQVSPVKKQQ